MRTTAPSRTANKEIQLATDFPARQSRNQIKEEELATDFTVEPSTLRTRIKTKNLSVLYYPWKSAQSVVKTSSHAQKKSLDQGRAFLAAILIGLCCHLAASLTCAQSIDAMPPVVVKTVPESGRADVKPGVTEIRVTYSKEMTDRSWSWCEPWKGANPAALEKPLYEGDHKTCVLKVGLEPNKTYAYWLNTEKFQNFKDRQGHPAVPYLLVFQTSAAHSTPATTQPDNSLSR